MRDHIGDDNNMVTDAGWTAEKPTAAGWYWLIENGWSEPEVVQVKEVGILWRVYFSSGRRDELKFVDGEWLGPIAPTDRAQGRVEGLQRERDEAKEMQRSMYQGMANKLSELKPSHHPMYRAGVQEIIAAAFNGYQADKAQPVLLSEWQAQEICLAKLQAALDAEREKAAQQGRYAVDLFNEIQRMKKAWCEERAGFESDLVKAETERDKLQALVLALPVYEADALITVDGDLDEIDRPALRSAVMELLEYRATLDATAPAVCPDCNGEGAVDSGGTDPNGHPLMRRCGCREKGGDGE